MASTYDLTRTLEALNHCLADEAAAAEVYSVAAKKVPERLAEARRELEALQLEHNQAAQGLQNEIGRLGGSVLDGAGVVSVWANAAREGDPFADGVVLGLLKEGEEHTLKIYDTALRDQSLAEPRARRLIEQLYMNQQRRMGTIERLMEIPI